MQPTAFRQVANIAVYLSYLTNLSPVRFGSRRAMITVIPIGRRKNGVTPPHNSCVQEPVLRRVGDVAATSSIVAYFVH